MHISDASFNQDHGCFAVAHSGGFLVYNSNPVELRVDRSLPDIEHVTMLHRTNYLGLVGTELNTRFSPNKLTLWDDLKQKSGLVLEFDSAVCKALLLRVRIVAVLQDSVQVYIFSAPPKKLATYETFDNPYGLADLANSFSDLSETFQILAFPGNSVGLIQIVDVSFQGQKKNLISIVKAHQLKIRNLALNRSGTLLASASESGTIIRVHSTQSTALLFEFRRGVEKVDITSISFSHDDSKLAVLSSKGTLHVFTLEEKLHNKTHILKKIPVSYFQSKWSFCLVSTGHDNDHGVLGWLGNDSIIVVWKDQCLWEKYAIVERDGWQLLRFSWKSLSNNA